MSLKNKSISIIGLGWLGLPLARKLKALGHTILGSTTTSEKAKTLIEHEVIETLVFNLENAETRFYESDILIFNTPPNPLISNFFQNHTNKNQKIIFISSASVYSASQGEVNENATPLPESVNGKLLFEIENELKNTFPNLSIIRPGGLIGDTRHPIFHLKNIKDPENFVHLIFRDDLISLITAIIEKEKPPLILNAVAQISMSKKDYYLKMSEKLQLERPSIENVIKQNATYISDEMLIRILGKTPRSPLEFAL